MGDWWWLGGRSISWSAEDLWAKSTCGPTFCLYIHRLTRVGRIKQLDGFIGYTEEATNLRENPMRSRQC